MESVGAVVTKKIIEKIFLQKVMKRLRICQNFWKKKVIIFNDYACPKYQELIFKDEEYYWRCSSYPFCHAKALHCAKRKAFAHGTWTRCFSNNL